MNILITGGTGFIGTHYIRNYIAKDDNIYILTRNKDRASKQLNDTNIVNNINYLESIDNDLNFDVIINLAGEPIADSKWTKSKVKKLFDSRINTTKKLINYISTKNSSNRPKILVNGSAIGCYGIKDKDGEYDENSSPSEVTSVSHRLCRQWEQEALKAEDFGVDVKIVRIGVVLGKNGGALQRMLPPFKLGLGGKIACGKQYMSWVHIDDLCKIIKNLSKGDIKSNIVNATAPKPVTNEDFSKTLAKKLNRPAIFTTPAFVMKLAFGEMAEELLINGQKIIPTNLQNENFNFEYENLDSALENILNDK
jgi:hypothetical protein